MAEIPAGYGAVLFVLLATLLCGVARRLLSKVLTAGGDARRYAGEIVSTFQLVTGMLEGDVVMEVQIYNHSGRQVLSDSLRDIHFLEQSSEILLS